MNLQALCLKYVSHFINNMRVSAQILMYLISSVHLTSHTATRFSVNVLQEVGQGISKSMQLSLYNFYLPLSLHPTWKHPPK